MFLRNLRKRVRCRTARGNEVAGTRKSTTRLSPSVQAKIGHHHGRADDNNGYRYWFVHTNLWRGQDTPNFIEREMRAHLVCWQKGTLPIAPAWHPTTSVMRPTRHVIGRPFVLEDDNISRLISYLPFSIIVYFCCVRVLNYYPCPQSQGLLPKHASRPIATPGAFAPAYEARRSVAQFLSSVALFAWSRQR
jgi:hypothetical protein